MEKLKIIVESLESIKASDIKILDMKGFSPLFDYMVLANVKSTRQANATITHFRDDLVANGYSIRNVEGKDSNWILIDTGDVLINVFSEEQRLYYNLDKLFLDMPIVDVNNL